MSKKCRLLGFVGLLALSENAVSAPETESKERHSAEKAEETQKVKEPIKSSDCVTQPGYYDHIGWWIPPQTYCGSVS